MLLAQMQLRRVAPHQLSYPPGLAEKVGGPAHLKIYFGQPLHSSDVLVTALNC